MMKQIGVLCVLALATMALPVFAAGGESDENMIFSKMKIVLLHRNAPSDRTDSTFSGNGSLRNQWAVFSVDYTPRVPAGNRGGNRASVWIDDVTLKLTVTFNGQSNGRPILCVFTGEARFWSIPLDGRRRNEVMMIPPHLFDRYLPTNGSESTLGSNNCNAEAVFLDREGQVIGRVYYAPKMTAVEAIRYFAGLSKVAPKVVVEHGVLNRRDTPWAERNMDSFDLIKPDRVK